MLQNQSLLGIAFFGAIASVILLVLFLLFRRDQAAGFFRWWLAGWFFLTFSSLTEVASFVYDVPALSLATILGHFAALLLFLSAVLKCTATGPQRNWPVLPAIGVFLAFIYYFERSTSASRIISWETAELTSAVCLWAGFDLWRWARLRHGHGARLLAGVFLLSGLHGLDRPLWQHSPLFYLRVAFDHLTYVALGIAMVVLALERARARTEELHKKMNRLTLLTTATTQTLSVKEVLEKVLIHLVQSLDATHGVVRLLETEGTGQYLVIRASVGFSADYLQNYKKLSASEPWARQVLKEDCQFVRFEETTDAITRKRMAETGQKEMVTLALPGKAGPLGIIAVGSTRSVRFQEDELSYLVNIANLLGLTLQNVRLFEQVSTVQQQWADTFDSIGDPILVHDFEGKVLRANVRLGHLLQRENSVLVGRHVIDLLVRRNANYKTCPYCEGIAGEGDEPDPWLPGYFLASNSSFADAGGHQLGTVHVLKDISDRKRAEEKYRSLVSSVQEGVFISTPQGRFLDFNDAFLRMSGYERREELLGTDIPSTLFVNSADRERLKRLLHEHGSVADFEFEMRRKDGEVRTVLESSIAVRDAAGNVSAYQGFLLDITERKHAEHQIRRRNRELMVLNSIAQTLTESMDLADSLHRTLRHLCELFSLDATSLYLIDEKESRLRRVAAVGHRSEYAKNFPIVKLQPELLKQIRSVHARFIPVQGLPLPPVFHDAQKQEDIVSAYVVMLWSKDRIMGGLVVGSRTPRDFSPADANLLIAVGTQISSAIERTLLFEETRQAYENLRKTQEQLLHSEKMAAVGQLISGVAHELNNPLTAILGYSQLLTSSGQIGPLGIEYSDKLYKQAQRTHRIVQNLLSFSRQHKPERVGVQINQLLEDTLALRDYDLRMSSVRVHMELDENLPRTEADPHQLQQVFLNLVNNAVDAILDTNPDGDLWVRTGVNGKHLFVEFTDSGPGVQDASRVFDPFYTTKPVGKGTGLGLSICYGIITEHGGTIRVSNAPPRGASFCIELPLHTVGLASLTKARTKPDGARGGRILLLEHDESVLEAVSAILLGGDHQVYSVRNLAETDAALKEQEFDVLVAELDVPGTLGGKEINKLLELRAPYLTNRLIWMLASAPSGLGLDATTQHTGRPVLQKPFKAVELLSAVEAALSSVDTTAVVEG